MKTINQLLLIAPLATISWSGGLAAMFTFDSNNDWGGISAIEISQSAYDFGSGSVGDVLSFELYSHVFHDGVIRFEDPGVTFNLTGGFFLSPDKQLLYLPVGSGDWGLMVTDTPYEEQFLTRYQPGSALGTHGAQAWDYSIPPLEHTTDGDWMLTSVPELGSTMVLLCSGLLGCITARFRGRWIQGRAVSPGMRARGPAPSSRAA